MSNLHSINKNSYKKSHRSRYVNLFDGIFFVD
nr:MAG TPA: hypothetical protein [Caudoviricetes sp.]